MKVNILGTEYEIIHMDYTEEAYFEKHNCDGYCDSLNKIICVCNLSTHPVFAEEASDYCKKAEKSILRHEIVHAFLNESGLQDSSGIISNIGWAKNEEMVDWIAL